MRNFQTKNFPDISSVGNNDAKATDTKGQFHVTIDRLFFGSLCCLFFLVPISKSPAIIAGIFSIAIWLFSGKALKSVQRFKWNLLPVASLILLQWIGLFFAENTSYGLGFAKSSYYWFYAVILGTAAFSVKEGETCLKAYIGGLSITACLSILQYVNVVPVRQQSLPVGLLGYLMHGSLALFLVLGMLIISAFFKHEKRRKYRILYALLIALFFVDLSVVVPGRTGYLAFVLLCPLIIYNTFGGRQVLIVLAGAGIMVLLLLLSPTVQERIKAGRGDLLQYGKGNPVTSLGLRLYMWKESWKLFIENPICGSGTGGFKTAWERRKPAPDVDNFNDPHNTFFHMAANFGVIGIATLLFFYIELIRSGLKAIGTPLGFSVFSFSLVLIIGGLTNTLFVGSVNTAWVAIFAGLSGMLRE